jgi:cell division protein FtsL
MTRTKRYLTLFILINIFFIFLLIYKQSRFTKASYDQQMFEQQRNDLREEEMMLTRELYELKNPKKINEYATKKLGMKKMDLKQARKVSSEGKIQTEEN